jgi:hypothetical protein
MDASRFAAWCVLALWWASLLAWDIGRGCGLYVVPSWCRVRVGGTCGPPLYVQRQRPFDCFLWRRFLIYVGACVLCWWQWTVVDGSW